MLPIPLTGMDNFPLMGDPLIAGHIVLVFLILLFMDTLKNACCDTTMNTDKAIIAMPVTWKRHIALRPLCICAWAKLSGCNYKNVHTDAIALEDVGLLQRSEEGLLVVPWDVTGAHVRLIA